MIQANRSKTLPSIGFLTITRDAEQGLFGGYLVLNALGRPLEFHCTAPVRPSRAQQILYGPTLDPYLCGERIGQTLLKTSKREPLFVLTDVESVLAAGDLVPMPLMLIRPRGSSEPLTRDSLKGHPEPPDAAGPPKDDLGTGGLQRFELGAYVLAVNASHAVDSQLVTDAWSTFANQIDMDEPFERIREAIGEARNSAR